MKRLGSSLPDIEDDFERQARVKEITPEKVFQAIKGIRGK